MIFGKLILAFIGLKLAGFFHFSPLVGVIFGVLTGHIFDVCLQRKIAEHQAKKYWQNVKRAETNRNFVEALFIILGRLAQVDGPVNKQEDDKLTEIVKRYLKLDRKQLKKFRQLFIAAPNLEGTLQYHTARLYETVATNENMLFGFFQLLCEFAEADAPINAEEKAVLTTVAQIIGVPYGQPGQQFRSSSTFSSAGSSSAGNAGKRGAKPEPEAPQSMQDPYAVLGCSAEDSTDKIRSQYRKLAGEFHPDKIMGKDLSQEFIDFATERFKQITAAYDQIKQLRGF